MALGLWLTDGVMRYQFELTSCILRAFDTKQPFFSHDLEKIIQEAPQLGLRKSKVEADLRGIFSAAHQVPWIDEFGRAYRPLTRDEILSAMRNCEMIRDNFVKFYSLIKELTST